MHTSYYDIIIHYVYTILHRPLIRHQLVRGLHCIYVSLVMLPIIQADIISSDIPKHYILTFLSVTDTYVPSENRSHIQMHLRAILILAIMSLFL